MTHPAAGYVAGPEADYDRHDVDAGRSSGPMPRGPVDDASFRQERARRARAAQNAPGYHLRQVLRAGSDHDDARWAVAITAEQFPMTPAEVAAARRLAAALQWVADLAEVTP